MDWAQSQDAVSENDDGGQSLTGYQKRERGRERQRERERERLKVMTL